MFQVKSVDEVFNVIKEHFADIRLESQTVVLTEAVGRVLTVDLAANEDIPGFNRSSVDGYAVMAADTFGASESLPAQLPLSGEVQMGIKPGKALEKGCAMYVPTGGELPVNADAVVMIEHTEQYHDGFIYINKPAAPGTNVVFKGDDIRNGEIVLNAGRRLKPQDIGAIAALGIEKIPVKRKIRVGVLSTGDEVVDLHREVSAAKVRDVNTYSLFAGLLEYGAEPVLYGIVGDDYEAIRDRVSKAMGECDVVLISGGSSVGNKDVTYKVIDSLGKPGVLVHGIAVKPGKPTILGRIGSKAVFGLPGHPASAYFIFRIFVCRLLDIINGIHSEMVSTIKAEMACNYPSNNGREEYIPVSLRYEGTKLAASPVFGKSGLITLLTKADGYIHLNRGSEGIAAGKEVEVILF